MHHPLRTAAVFACGFLAGFASPAGAADKANRTAYERLDLATPEAAAHAFVRAWARRDFAEVYLVLSMKAQATADRSVVLFDPSHLMGPVAGVKALDVMLEGVPPMEQWEQSGPDYVFDRLFAAIDKYHALPLAFDDDTQIDPPRLLPDGSAETTAHSARMATPARLHLVRSSSGRWRVELAMAEAGNAAELPFGR